MGSISKAEAIEELEAEIAQVNHKIGHERQKVREHSDALHREEQALMNLLQQKTLLDKAA